MEVNICLRYKNEKEAKTVARAVSPDNVEVPAGLLVETTQNGNEVHTRVVCEKTLATLIATLDDLLACVSVAEKSFTVAQS